MIAGKAFNIQLAVHFSINIVYIGLVIMLFGKMRV